MPVTFETVQTPAPQTFAQQGDDDFLLDDGLPCLRRDGKLYYLTDVQPRVLEACRHFDISFDQLAGKLGMTRPVLLLILKGYDPVAPVLKGMIDRLLGQVGLLPPLTAQGASISHSIRGAASEAPPVVTTIESVPIPSVPLPEMPDAAEDEEGQEEDEAITVAAEAIGETLVPQPLTPGRPAASVPPLPPVVFTPGLPDFTPGLRRAPRRRRPRLGA
jgi:hypothetical protein